jgi:rfaE bifunctional protein nucleotidyltransferase chain/domain
VNGTHSTKEIAAVPGYAGYLQFDVRSGAVADNLAQVEEGLGQLKPEEGGIVVLPELWATGFAYDRLAELAGRTPELLQSLQELASQYQVYLAGSLPEKSADDDAIRYFNTLYVVGPEGLAGRYRKQQLFAPMSEDRFFTPGDNPAPLSTPLGRVAALVCYDLRFPELVQAQAAQGAGLLVVSAQWPSARLDHWRILVRARAIENQMFVVACNRCGTTGGTDFAGHSMLVAPDGAVLMEAGDTEGFGGLRLDPMLLENVRSRFSPVGRTPYRFHDQDKIKQLDELGRLVKRYKALGRKVVFTNGCFDILHVGHVAYLEAARREGDCLIVGLNSDQSVRSIKGPERPVNNQENRARMLAALGCVDHVVLFDEDTPHALITALMPDILAKGADWPVDEIVGAKEILASGGKVVSVPLVESFSTTSLIDKIRG